MPISKPELNEEALVPRAIAGNREAFSALIDLYDPVLRGFAFSLTGSQSAMDDVLQEAYCKAYRSIAKFKRNSSFKTWMFKIVRNCAYDLANHHRKVVPFGNNAPEPTTHHDVALSMDIAAALSQLSMDHRAAVLMIDGEGFDYDTACEILSIPRGTLASRVNAARSQLRTLLASSYKEQR